MVHKIKTRRIEEKFEPEPTIEEISKEELWADDEQIKELMEKKRKARLSLSDRMMIWLSYITMGKQV